MSDSRIELPIDFGRAVVAGIPGILEHQQPDGSIVYDPAAPVVYPQQAIFPLAYCWAGLAPDRAHEKDEKIRACIGRLGEYLVQRFSDKGEFTWGSYGNVVCGVDQRLTYAWTEGLRLLREGGADFPYDAWGKKIAAACETLIEHRLRKLEGVRRFVGRVMGTSANHVSLYLTTLYRAGQVLGRPDLSEYALAIARNFAADVHPDGYWEEHGDLLRSGGPTPSYNYLTHCAMSLMYEWTGESVFRAAMERSSAFHGNFCYPDAQFLELIDERVRHGHGGRIWGLFGFSHTPSGRGVARAHFASWRAHLADSRNAAPEALARHCENALYWHNGDYAPAPFERTDHRATLTLPAGIFRRGDWCVGLNAMCATNAEDPAYRDNPFALEKQKLFSVWHARAGLILDGSHAKGQPENSTFATAAAYAPDYWPCGGSVGEEDGAWVVYAAYKTFFGTAVLRPMNDQALQVQLSVDPAASRGPFAAGFTFIPAEWRITSAAGKQVDWDLNEPFEGSGADLGGRFRCGAFEIELPPEAKLIWPYRPFNSYAADRASGPKAALARVTVALSPERPRANFVIRVPN
ncbi:MAG: hypothetical protein AMXMBFR7_11100 [Planctomycetota bacterium]